MPPVYEALLLNTVVPQIQAAQAGDSYVMVVNATTPALRITQTGTGDSILVEDSSNPDSSPFVVTAAGDVGIGTSSPRSLLDLNSTRGVKAYWGTAGTLGETQSTAGDYVANNLFVSAESAGTMTYTKTTNDSGSAIIQDFSRGITFYTGVTGSATTTGTLNTFERMRLDASGNLGLGVTPSAWTTNWKAFQFGATSALSDFSNQSSFWNNTVVTGATTPFYQTTAAASFYRQTGGQHLWYNAPSGTAGDAITFTQAMTLDASGNLGVGATSPQAKLEIAQSADNTDGPKLRIANNGNTLSNGQLIGGIDFFNGDDSGEGVGAYIYSYTTDSIGRASGQDLRFATGGTTERARITSGGNCLIGTVSELSGNYKLQIVGATSGNGIYYQNTTNGGNAALFVNAAGSGVGDINVGASSTAYNTSSDYRLKNNIAPMTGALAKVAALKPVTYKWKADGSDGEGFIAHELQAVVPQCVTGEKDAVDAEGKPVYQGIDTSFLVATLTAAIKEQQAMINELKAEVAALKGA